MAIVAAVAAAGIGGIAWYMASRNPGVQSFPGLSRAHVQGKVSYPQTPPVGGRHSAVPLNCGIYRAPVPNENAVHSLEHGAVWITYRPGLPAASVTRLQDVVGGEPQAQRAYTILSPYPGCPPPWSPAAAAGRSRRHPAAAVHHHLRRGPPAPEPGVGVLRRSWHPRRLTPRRADARADQRRIPAARHGGPAPAGTGQARRGG